MADIQHKNIADADRHEPKGASTAAAGQVYVSDGAGSGAWESPASGAKVLLSTQNASNSAAISFVSLITSTYSTYEIEFYAVRPASGTLPDLVMLTSTNNGSSYATTAYKGTSAADTLLNAGTPSSPTLASMQASFRVVGSVNTPAAAAASGTVKLVNFPNTTSYKFVDGVSFTTSTRTVLGGVREAVTAINAVQFKFDTGNITSGTFKLYGIV